MTRHPGARGVRVLLPRPDIPAPAGERSAPKKSAVHPRRSREGPVATHRPSPVARPEISGFSLLCVLRGKHTKQTI